MGHLAAAKMLDMVGALVADALLTPKPPSEVESEQGTSSVGKGWL
jgi:hypothetical protein